MTAAIEWINMDENMAHRKTLYHISVKIDVKQATSESNFINFPTRELGEWLIWFVPNFLKDIVHISAKGVRSSCSHRGLYHSELHF